MYETDYSWNENRTDISEEETVQDIYPVTLPPNSVTVFEIVSMMAEGTTGQQNQFYII